MHESVSLRNELLGLALFAVFERVSQGVQCQIRIALLTVVSHQSDPYHLNKEK